MLDVENLRSFIVSEEMLVGIDVLLLHTIGAVVEAATAAFLVRALYRISRNGESPRGFISIAILMTLASLARLFRLILFWMNHKPPFWLETITLVLLLATILSVPVILSAFYLSPEKAAGRRSRRADWLQWAMTVNSIATFVAILISFAMNERAMALLTAAVGCTLSAGLLWFRATLSRNLQLRKRGVQLFSGLTAAGLLGISLNVLIGFGSRFGESRTLFDSAARSTLGELSNMLVVLGVMFVFASLRLADIIVKRVTALCIWSCVSLLVWKSVTALALGNAGMRQQMAGAALLSVALIAASLLLTPHIVRMVNTWIDAWVFQIPDFDLALHRFWETLSSLDSREAVYRAGETAMTAILGLASVRIVSELAFPQLLRFRPDFGPNPRFLPPGSPLAAITSPPADVLFPLFQDGTPDHWIALSRGIARPPWTASELSFVTRIAAEIQVRTATVLAEEHRLERLRRENALREQVADAELRALRAQINPHFLFNSLNTIADLAVVAPDKAEQMTLRLAAVFRYVLVHTDREFSSLKEELNFARSYLDIEEARFEHRLRVHFDVDEALLQETIPTLLLQPLIENAIKHGIGPRREGGVLTITAYRTQSGFAVTVADDGVGPASSAFAPSQGAHLGLANVRKRLATAYGKRARFALRDRDGGGAEARIDFEISREDLHESAAC